MEKDILGYVIYTHLISDISLIY